MSLSVARQNVTGHRTRPMVAEDLDEVLKVERLSFPKPWTRAQFESELTNPVSFPMVEVVTIDGKEKLGAYIVFWVVHGEAHILNVCVAPELRRLGLAKRIIKDALDVMQRHGAYEVFLEVRKSNSFARALYRWFGFKEIYDRPAYYGDEDAIVMRLVL